ncbi:hypothetical protein [Azospirillum brasilense]|uniref:hypothetical protein n=1 Tax=Azospirillum brasilense TaxID=192 RepID=UPI001586BF53|nr:hypothetical protein [Azospirillum brasilense]
MSGPEMGHGAIGAGASKIIPFRSASSTAAPLVAPSVVSPAPSVPRRPAVPPSARAAEGPPEPAPPTVRLARLIFMASVGGYMAVHEDTLMQLDGRMVWPTADALIRDAAAAGVPVSSHVINTARS